MWLLMRLFAVVIMIYVTLSALTIIILPIYESRTILWHCVLALVGKAPPVRSTNQALKEEIVA